MKNEYDCHLAPAGSFIAPNTFIVFVFKNARIHAPVAACIFRPFVDHISAVIPMNARKWFVYRPFWSSENALTGSWLCVFFFSRCLYCFFSGLIDRYPAASNNATGFFYTIIICSVINTLSLKTRKEYIEFWRMRAVQVDFDFYACIWFWLKMHIWIW